MSNAASYGFGYSWPPLAAAVENGDAVVARQPDGVSGGFAPAAIKPTMAASGEHEPAIILADDADGEGRETAGWSAVMATTCRNMLLYPRQRGHAVLTHAM